MLVKGDPSLRLKSGSAQDDAVLVGKEPSLRWVAGMSLSRGRMPVKGDPSLRLKSGSAQDDAGLAERD